jgi:hypothetical protein
MAAERASIAGEFAGRRASLHATVESEFAVKMAAVMMATPRREQGAALAALHAEHAAKAEAVRQHVAGEQKAAEQARVGAMRQRHAQERKNIGRRFIRPVRNTGTSALNYQHKEFK